VHRCTTLFREYGSFYASTNVVATSFMFTNGLFCAHVLLRSYLLTLSGVFMRPCVRSKQTLLARYLLYLLTEFDQTYTTNRLWARD